MLVREKSSELIARIIKAIDVAHTFGPPYVSRVTVVLNFCACTYGRSDESAAGDGELTGVAKDFRVCDKNSEIKFCRL